MKSLQEVLESIEAFKKDMEDLGVEIKVSVTTTSYDIGPAPVIDLKFFVSRELKEDLKEG
jgi:hypothetical protein